MNLETAIKVFKEVASSFDRLTDRETLLICEVFKSIITGCFRQFDPDAHLLTRENPNRFVSRPIIYKKLWQQYNKAVASFWTVNEIDLREDVIHWKEELNDDERHFISHVLAFFASFDGVVIENLVNRLLTESQIPEARSFYAMQVAVEAIHSDTYGALIDAFITEEEERVKLFNATEHFPLIKEKEEWAMKWTESNDADISEILIAFAAVEGIYFSGAFAAIFWLKKRGRLPGLTFSNELISRDEGLHRDFACLLFKEGLVNKPKDDSVIEKIITEAVDIEKKFWAKALPVSLIGMNCELMKKYIEFVADKLLVELGRDKYYNTENPFDFMDNISLENKTNFFEKRVAEYQRPGVMDPDRDFDLDCEF